jgi:hypothetical protein
MFANRVEQGPSDEALRGRVLSRMQSSLDRGAGGRGCRGRAHPRLPLDVAVAAKVGARESRVRDRAVAADGGVTQSVAGYRWRSA